MSAIKFLAVAALAVPGLAFAQVGPNPAVNGSLDPTVGASTDTRTAPDDVSPGHSMSPGASMPSSDPAANSSSSATATDNATDANANMTSETKTTTKTKTKHKPR